ncbi:uncharacterized protein LOC128228950 [Mya arenaria]|uniref:uncharacterized protein LOC128228950 n=1 Tax=Mya arenaria TaxID=6604 RepID=UPI0022E85328|nr:uncharacterized protein LOC128228950 [Mya arenaria]
MDDQQTSPRTLRPRRSKSSTPIGHADSIGSHTPNGIAAAMMVTPIVRRMTPSTPGIDASFMTGDKVSPMLAKLRMTPGRLLKDKQTLLVRKHEETRRNLDKLNVGGGVSMWPEMVSMRLTRVDVYILAGLNVVLAALVVAVFLALHGGTIKQLLVYSERLLRFSHKHRVVVDNGQEALYTSLVDWHNGYKDLVSSIHESFDVSNVPWSYRLYLLAYVAVLVILFYYLIDNMFAKSKLSPKRIKRWVSILVLTSAWTLMIAVMYVIALQTEMAIENNVYNLANSLADVISTNLSSAKYQQVLMYWQTKCLPPTSHGTISIFGILPVRDVTYYLQYYSVPLATVLLTPVFRLVVALLTLYNNDYVGKIS